jgi:uncharacterized membrane protein
MENQEIKEEIRKEFQLDRIILFSDAVFAIVITLMAIEIRLPKGSHEPFGVQMTHLIPVVFAYAVSFGFIGQIWYQHLKVFGLLKDYDAGLVIRNLVMLFWMGFIPFSVTLIAEQSNRFASIVIYFTVIALGKGAQLVLQHYILVMRPNLRIGKDPGRELLEFKKSRLALIMLIIVFILVASTMLLVKDPETRNAAWWWFLPFPFLLKYLQKRLLRPETVR